MAIRYGDMREEEADLLDGLLTAINQQWGCVSFLEIGVFTGDTVRGVARFCQQLGCPVAAAGVDFEQWRPNPPPECSYTFYAGDSMDAWRGLTGIFNLLFVDGCHCVNHSMCDFLNYSPFVQVGGYVLFHDTALPIAGKYQEAHPQNHGYAGQPDSVLGVREGLTKLGLLQDYRADWKLVKELPSDSGLMGMCLFRKVKEL